MKRVRLFLEALEQRELLSVFGLGNAIWRASNSNLFFDFHQQGVVNQQRVYGASPGLPDQIVSADFNGDGITDLAIYRSGTWFIDYSRDSNSDRTVTFGGIGDIPLGGDVNGDGIADLIVYHPSTGVWDVDNSTTGVLQQSSKISNVGVVAGDIPVVGDFNGDGRLDRAIFRNGTWYVDFGFSGTATATFGFGQAGDKPFVADYNDDGIGDLGLYRTVNGQGTFFVDTTKTGQASITESFGGDPSDVPIPGYYDPSTVAHGLQANFGVFQSSTGNLYYSYNQGLGGVSNQVRQFGAPGDKLVAGDFNGDTVTDNGVFRNGAWYISTNQTSIANYANGVHLGGVAGDIPLAGDVNNDGLADIIVYRPSTGQWFVNYNRGFFIDGNVDKVSQFGGDPADLPAVGDFNGDGITDRAIFRNGTWFIDYGFTGTVAATVNFGQAGDKPFAFDFNNDLHADLGVYHTSGGLGLWRIDTNRSGILSFTTPYGGPGTDWSPIPGYYNTANSIFVAAGAGGNGTFGNPLGSINAAVNAAAAGSLIRIAPGAYNESVTVANRSNLTFVGAARFNTYLPTSNGDSFGATFANNIYLYNLTFNSQGGSARGVTVQGSRVFAEGIRTVNGAGAVLGSGIVAISLNGVSSLLDIRDSSLDSSQVGNGLEVDGGTTVRLTNVSANGEGTSSATPVTGGRGIIIVNGGNVATFRGIVTSNDRNGGLNANSGSAANVIDLLAQNSSFSNNPLQNGAYIAWNVNFRFENDHFDNNGTIRNASQGFNGLEIADDNPGAGTNFVGNGIVLNSFFLNNTLNGAYFGSGQNLQVIGNQFVGNLLGITLNGDPTTGDIGSPLVLIVSNSFQIGAPSALQERGIFAQGSNATARVGSTTASLKNTFTNYSGTNQISIHSHSGAHLVSTEGTVLTAANASTFNNFVNSTKTVFYD